MRSPRRPGQLLTTALLQIGKFSVSPTGYHSPRSFSSVSEVINIDTELLKPLAAKFNLSLTSFGEVITDPSAPFYGSAALSSPWGTQFEPAPVSPYKGSVAFDTLSGTIKSVYNVHRELDGDDNIKVYPAYITGNTGNTNCPPSFPVDSHTKRYQILLEAIRKHLSIQSWKWVGEGKSGKYSHCE